MSSIEMLPIGVIRTPYRQIEGMPIQPSGAKDTAGQVVLNEAYADGLIDLEGFSHIILIYCFHLSKGFELRVKPFLDDRLHGLFATRAPRRPNPIGLSVVRLVRREDNVLHVRGIDVVDQTPLLDIKPYVPAFDAPEDVRTGWLEKQAKHSSRIRSDERFK